MTNILNCHVIYYKFRSSRKQKQRPLEAQALNFRVLMDCLNQENLRKLKGAVSLILYERNILVILTDKIVSLRRNFSKVLVILP